MELKNPQNFLDFFDAQDLSKNGKVKQARAFWIRTYLSKDGLDLFLQTNIKRIRSYAYILHDRDADENGELVQPHYHLVLRMYSQWSRKRIYKLFVPFLWNFNNGQWDKIANIDLQISSDYKANFTYLTHDNDPDKYQYDKSLIVSNDPDDFGNHDDKCKDGAFEIVNDIIDGKSQLFLLKKYGREYVYHKKQYELIAQCIIYEENQFMEECDAKAGAALMSKPKLRYYEGGAAEALNEIRRILGKDDYI